jgi:class 3 adenylate cyclase/predicted ATPase
MFCDLVDSTALSARIDPEDLHEIIGAYRRCIRTVMTRFGGFVARYIGDGVLVYFGFPRAREHDAELAIHAGLATVEAISRLTLVNGYRPQVRIGIETGLVVIGGIHGTGMAPEQEVAGETPNLAARLQSVAEPNGVVIGAKTRHIVGNLFAYKSLGQARLKGYAESVEVWQVLHASSVDSRFEARHEAAPTQLIGRDAEFELLLRRWRQARNGEGQLVLLSGEPGIGKSCLIEALRARLDAEPHALLRYFCSPHQQASPLYPCIRQIERMAGFVRDDSAPRKLEKLNGALIRFAEHPDDIGLIADLVSVPTDDRPEKPALSPRKLKEKTLDALVRQLEHLSLNRPVLVTFEDMHWSDQTSRDLVGQVAKRIALLPILLIVTYRPEFDTAWTAGWHATRISLDPLSRRDGVALVEKVAGAATLPREVIDDIVERTDGVPLFLEEMTKAVLEPNPDPEAGDFRPIQPHRAASVPAVLHAPLMARLDRLGAAKEIAQIGAAIGREFSHELLSAIARKGDAELTPSLERLVESGLVFRHGTAPHESYLFKHALVQDAAYGTLMRGTRKELHQRIVEALEGSFAETAGTQCELLARHCTEAGLIEKASEYWFKAGQQALARSAMVECVAQIKQGLSLLLTFPESPWRHRQELNFQIVLGMALIATKGYAVATTGETFARARYLCDRLNSPPQLVSVLHGQWTHSLLRGDLTAARGRGAELLSLGEARNDPVWTLMGCRFSGVTRFPLGEFASGRDYLARALALYDPAQRSIYAAMTVDDTLVVILTYQSWLLMSLGDLDHARRCGDMAIEEARRVAQPYSLAHALNGAIFVELFAYSPQLALNRLEELLALTHEHGISYYWAVATIFRGWCLAAVGQEREGIAALTQGLSAYRATGSVLYLPTFIAMLAEAYGKAHEPEQGLKHLAEATLVADTTGERWNEAELNRLRAELLLALDDSPGADESFRRALTIARRQDAKLLELRAATGLTRLWQRQGRRAEASALLTPVCGSFTQGFDSAAFKDAQAALGSFT